jgi:diacylglycerol kinase (ATP)
VKKGRTRTSSFRDAFAGLWLLVRAEPNARIHLLITILVISIGLWLNIPSYHWGLIIFAIGLVWTTEAFNTALENLGDRISPDYHPVTKRAKDLGAAAVLVSSIAAATIGTLVFGPPLWARLIGI